MSFNQKTGQKHMRQSSWKKVAMVLFNGDVCQYYAWFIKKRYNLELNKPLRNAHVTFINDKLSDFKADNISDVDILWDAVKEKWDGKYIDVVLNVEARTNDKTWWLNIPQENREELQAIRNELGLGRPFFGLHMSIGYANEINLPHSEYIHRLIKTGLIK